MKQNIFFMNSLNFGDALNYWMLRKMGYDPVLHETKDEDHLIMCGSILNHANEHSTVWGAGLAWEGENFKRPGKVCAVRGRKSLERLIELGHVDEDEKIGIGDPAMLMPVMFQWPRPLPSYEVGIIPHYVDYGHVLDNAPKGVKIIDIMSGVQQVVKDLLDCRMIISSSLHGIVLADAYEIPNEWVEFSDKVIGDGFKFNDHFTAVGREEREPFDSRDMELPEVKEEKVTFDINQLIELCPLNWQF